MAMAAPIPMSTGQPPMPIDPRLLTLTQWLSPAFPVGAFAYSHGLETAVAEGRVQDGDGLFDWLRDVLEDGSGLSDAIWIRATFEAPDRAQVDHLDARARAFAPAAERLREAERQGTAFARVAGHVWDLDLGAWLLPVAMGRAAHLAELEPEAVTVLYLQAFTCNLVAAAQRLMPLGQTEAQQVLARLNPVCLAVATHAATLGPDDIYSNAFLSDIAAMRHETLQPRLFQS